MDGLSLTDRCTCGPALVAGAEEAYNEPAFRYFLGLERRRAARSRRSMLVLVVRLKNTSRSTPAAESLATQKLFAGLWLSLREVDFVGWFRAGRLAGAVLTQGDEAPTQETRRRIAERILTTLAEHVPASMIGGIQLRVVRILPEASS